MFTLVEEVKKMKIITGKLSGSLSSALKRKKHGLILLQQCVHVGVFQGRSKQRQQKIKNKREFMKTVTNEVHKAKDYSVCLRTT